MVSSLRVLIDGRPPRDFRARGGNKKDEAPMREQLTEIFESLVINFRKLLLVLSNESPPPPDFGALGVMRLLNLEALGQFSPLAPLGSS